MPADPAQLLAHARKELPQGKGAPPQVDLRRCVSTAYYAVFHAVCSAVANEFAYTSGRGWTLFYRALDHVKAKNRCRALAKQRLDAPERAFFGRNAFPADLVLFAEAFSDLQDLRHSCDYDPDFRLSKETARDAVDKAGWAIGLLAIAPNPDKREFLAYVLFGLRPQ